MSKVVVTLGYKPYVVDVADGVKLAEILGRAEIYEKKYRKGLEGEDSDYHYTYHVWAQESDDAFGLSVIPDEVYKIAKLAGKPINE